MSCISYSYCSSYSNIDGKEKSSVVERKQIDDQYITKKTVIDENGEKNVTTDYHNVSEKELENFNKVFNNEPLDYVSHDNMLL